MTNRLLSAFAVLFVVTTLPVHAQSDGASLTFGYIDTDAIIVQMPEFEQVQAQVQSAQAEVDSVLAARILPKRDSLQTAVEELNGLQNSSVVNETALQEKQETAARLQFEIQQIQQQGIRYLSSYEARLLQPVLNRVDEAIAAVAEERGIDMVLSQVANNAPVVLYASDRGVNMTPLVMDNLGIEPQQMQAPGAGQPQAPTGTSDFPAPPASGGN